MRAEDILDALSGVDDRHITAASCRKKKFPRWAKALTAAACALLTVTVGIHTLYRFEFLTAGCGAWPGTIVGDAYYYRVPHSGIWKYTATSGAEFLLSTYWEDGTLINDYGLYFDRGRSLYVRPHDTGKVTRLYTAPFTQSSHIGLDLEPDGTVIVTVYNKNEKYYSQLRMDGQTGEILEILSHPTPYHSLELLYTQSTFQVGERIVKLEPVAESGLEWVPFTLTEDGSSILPEGIFLSQYPVYVGDDLYFDVDGTDEWQNSADAVTTSETVLLVRPDGTTRLLERPRYYYCGGNEKYLFYVDHSAREDRDYASAIGAYEIATGEYWSLSRIGGEDIDVYEFTTDGSILHSSCPWDDAQTLWHIVYENGRPAALKLIDADITQ